MHFNKLLSVKTTGTHRYSHYSLSGHNYRVPRYDVGTHVDAYRMATWDVHSVSGNDSLSKYKSVVKYWPLQDVYVYGDTLNDIHMFKNMPVNAFMFQDLIFAGYYGNFMHGWPLNNLQWNTFYSDSSASYSRLYNLIKNGLPFANIRSLTIINTHDPSGGFNELARAIALVNLGTLDLQNIPINHQLMQAINKSGIHKLTMGGFMFDEENYPEMMDAARKSTVTDLTLTDYHDAVYIISFPKLTKLSITDEYVHDITIGSYIDFIKHLHIRHLDINVAVTDDRLFYNLPKTLKYLKTMKSVIDRYKHLLPLGLKYKVSYDDTDE